MLIINLNKAIYLIKLAFNIMYIHVYSVCWSTVVYIYMITTLAGHLSPDCPF